MIFVKDLPTPAALRRVAESFDSAGAAWATAIGKLGDARASGSTHLAGQLSSSYVAAATAIQDRTDHATTAYSTAAQCIRELATYIEKVGPEFHRLVTEVNSRNQASLSQPLTPATSRSIFEHQAENPEYRLQWLNSQIASRVQKTADAINAQAGLARDAVAAIQQQVTNQIVDFAVQTVVGTAIAIAVPEVFALYGGTELVGAATASRNAAALGADGLIAGRIAASVIDAAAARGAVGVVAETGLPVSATILRGGYTYVTDGLGRVVRVFGDLQLESGARVGSNVASGIRGLGNPQTDDAGHLIARMFKGPNEKVNLVPQDANLNRLGPWRDMERNWAERLNNGERVPVDMRIVYRGSDTRPYSFNVTSPTSIKPLVFRNRPGG